MGQKGVDIITKRFDALLADAWNPSQWACM
jgi:hypothetical protein